MSNHDSQKPIRLGPAPIPTVNEVLMYQRGLFVEAGMDVEQAFKCYCGRDIRTVHCPGCGRKSSYTKPRLATNVVLKDGTLAHAMAFHCRGCGITFNDKDRWEGCHAPPDAKMSVRAHRAMDRLSELPSASSKELLKEFAEKTGRTVPALEQSGEATKPGSDQDVVEQVPHVSELPKRF